MYDTAEEIHQKLSGCIVLYKERPFYVIDASPNLLGVRGYYVHDETKALNHIEINDPRLDFRNLGDILGYMHFTKLGPYTYNESTYLMRQPVRKSIQGLSRHNVYVFPLWGNEKEGIPRSGAIRFDEEVYGKNRTGFLCMADNNYPTLRAIRQAFEGDSSLFSMAFHKKWAIQKDAIGPFYVLYKNNKIGYTEDFDRIRIAKRYRFLEPDLKKIRG